MSSVGGEANLEEPDRPKVNKVAKQGLETPDFVLFVQGLAEIAGGPNPSFKQVAVAFKPIRPLNNGFFSWNRGCAVLHPFVANCPSSQRKASPKGKSFSSDVVHIYNLSLPHRFARATQPLPCGFAQHFPGFWRTVHGPSSISFRPFSNASLRR